MQKDSYGTAQIDSYKIPPLWIQMIYKNKLLNPKYFLFKRSITFRLFTVMMQDHFFVANRLKSHAAFKSTTC